MSAAIESNSVCDTEHLFRSVKDIPENHRMVHGQSVISASAFNDRNKRPSVNRELLRPDPHLSKLGETDGIVKLKTCDVRGIKNIPLNPSDPNCRQSFDVDVVPRPNPPEDPDNDSHAQVEASPHPESAARFKKIKERLALLATQNGWTIEPGINTPPPSIAKAEIMKAPSLSLKKQDTRPLDPCWHRSLFSLLKKVFKH